MTQELENLPAGPERDDQYDAYAIRYARNPNRRIHDNFMRRDMPDGAMPLDSYFWLLRNAHRTIVVDTGFGRRIEAERRLALDLDPIEALRRIGVEPDEIDDVILTHLHYDHAGNIDRFGRARFHVQEAEIAYATGSCMANAAVRWTFDVETVAEFVRLTFADRVRHHAGFGAPLPGITLHPLPGHSEGLQGVRVNTGRGPILLASDACVYYANLARQAPFAITINVRDTLAAFASIAGLVPGIEHVVPGHDPKVREFFPLLCVAGVELVALHRPPRPHTLETLRTL